MKSFCRPLLAVLKTAGLATLLRASTALHPLAGLYEMLYMLLQVLLLVARASASIDYDINLANS